MEIGNIVVDNVFCLCYVVIFSYELVYWSFVLLRFVDWLFLGIIVYSSLGMYWYVRIFYKIYISWYDIILGIQVKFLKVNFFIMVFVILIKVKLVDIVCRGQK